jgi:predicted nucleic acid-binding protein
VNIVDTSGWLEYLQDGSNSNQFGKPIHDTRHLLVPTVIMYEVFKFVLRETGEDTALRVQAQLQRGKVIPLDQTLAIDAARLSLLHKLPMADAMILACAQQHNAELWTQDAHFRTIPGVRYFAKDAAKILAK